MVDTRGVLSFLAITFVVTYTAEGALALAGASFTGIPPVFAQLTVAAVMWVPALAAVLTVTLVTREGFAVANLRLGSWKPYLAAALLVPAGFLVIYALTWLLRLGAPDWRLEGFRAFLAAHGGRPLPLPPSRLLPLVFLVSLIPAPFVNGLFGFGEELGWRGYLLPKLLPLGKPRAYLLVGVTWGLWHLPLVLMGFNYPRHRWWGVVAMTALTTALGLSINELTLRHRSSLLAGWIHGLFNSQAYGIWRALLFPDVEPLLGGATGLVGILVWTLIGLGVVSLGWSRQEPTTRGSSRTQKHDRRVFPAWRGPLPRLRSGGRGVRRRC